MKVEAQLSAQEAPHVGDSASKACPKHTGQQSRGNKAGNLEPLRVTQNKNSAFGSNANRKLEVVKNILKLFYDYKLCKCI